MKQPSAATHVNGPKTVTGSSIGLGILAVIVVAVAAWLQLQSKYVAIQSATAPLAPMANADLSRFSADSWYLPSDALLGFVAIPAGPFVMGSDPSIDMMAFANEQWSENRHQGLVNVPAFYIGRYEVTVAQFRAFTAATGFKADALALSGDPDHPVANVSWTDALAYSRWLEAQLKQSAHAPASLSQLLRAGWHVTIPNEAQWEKAARGSDERIYPWGNTVSHEYANFMGATVTSVGRFACPKCAFGIADMSGNVWELTRSVYQAYPFDSKSTPNLQADALFVMRGGSYGDAENTVRAAVRGGIDPGARRPFIGFRVVLTQD